MVVLKATDLKKTFEGTLEFSSTHALNGINISIEDGEFVAVMGPSGSGKTTLLTILGGIDTPSSGTVEIDGKVLEKMSQDEIAEFRRRRLGFVFQEFNLIDSLNVKENILLPMILEKSSPDEMEKRAKDLMCLFDINTLKNKYPCYLSGGQQQRVAIARALVNNPAIVLADEPTGNLDSKSAMSVMKCFEEINNNYKATILMVTHDPFAASYCKRVLFIRDGEVYTEIVNKNGRKEFFDTILDTLSMIGGERVDI